MAAYKGQSRKIKDAVIQHLTGLTYDAGGGAEAMFVEVSDNTKDDFAGFPALRVLPADVQDVKGAVSQNDRTLDLMLLVHVPLENPLNLDAVKGDSAQNQQNAINTMLDYGDIIIDSLDTLDWTDGGNLSDNGVSVGTIIINTRQVGWEVLALKSGAVLLCRIDVSIKYSKNN